MSEPIPAAELAAFREVVNGATPGPWVERVDSYSTDIVDTSDDAVVVGKYTGIFGDDFDTMTPGNRKFIAQSREMCGRLLDYVEWLRTWPGMMSVLDEHYPADVFDGSSGDPGSRIVSLVREVDRLKAALAAKGGE